MALASGTRLGVYEIDAPLGAGGMGEVYRARDTNLGRAVAIKILPDSVAGDTEREARFQREAHILASLNHPHIAAIYGLERSAGTRFLVLELVDGETLARKLKTHPGNGQKQMAVSRDGQRLLMAAVPRAATFSDVTSPPIAVVTNWAAALVR